MSKVVTFGLGGYCENCDKSHSHPLHNIVETIEVPDSPHKPLNESGVFATLNAVLGVWSLTDAANAVGLSEQDLINEAQAWAIGAQNGN